MKPLLIHILLTALLTGCAGLEILSELAGAVSDNRQHKCNMDVTQCAKYGLEQDKPQQKRKCKSRTEVDCWTVYSGND